MATTNSKHEEMIAKAAEMVKAMRVAKGQAVIDLINPARELREAMLDEIYACGKYYTPALRKAHDDFWIEENDMLQGYNR
jgi:hypothetical protein